jgi:hypothetical protein
MLEGENAMVVGRKVVGDDSSRLRSNTGVITSTKAWEVVAEECTIVTPCVSRPVMLLNAPGGNDIVAISVNVTLEPEGAV